MVRLKRIYRYDATAAKYMSCNCKPEPWLHVAVVQAAGLDGNGKFCLYNECHCVVFVWDTREIVGKGMTNIHNIHNAKANGEPLHKAKDNGQPLTGKDADVFNSIFKFGNATKSTEAVLAEDGVEGFMLKIKGQPGQYFTSKVFDTKEEAKAYAEQHNTLQYCSIVKERSTPTKAEQLLRERQERANQHYAKRNEQEQRKAEVAKYKSERKNANANWEGSSSANKMFKAIRSQFNVMPDAECPNKTTFVKWVDAHWHEFIED